MQNFVITPFNETFTVARCSIKMVYLEILQNSQGNTGVRVSFLKKLQLRPGTLFKKDSFFP